MERLLRWLLMLTILAAFLAIHTDAVKATSLIFGKTSTTSTEAPLDDPSASGDEATEKSDNSSSKGTLTGIPQIDYIWDPNLPRELNGYNLSNYPFLNSVPDLEDIDFKCDGLHDGFYASVKYDCQLYHHCLFGVRYDFLCANFTAFDQKTFICHFVSEVDCKNSPKYWHRNDALYEAATTTTQKPSTTTTTTMAPPPPPTLASPMRPRLGRPYRRPYRRRRPQVDYYYEDEDYEDDYYEERIHRRRKQRPRPRRPEYDDYEEEDRYEPRQPYNSERTRSKPEGDDYEYDRRFERPRYRPRPYDDRRGYTDRRHRPDQERRYPEDERRPMQDRRKPLNDRRPLNDGTKQPRHEEEDKVIKRPIQETTDDSGKIRPSGGSGSNPLLFAPRTPPKIRRPVPINERQKYEYSTTTSTKAPAVEAQLDEYYDDEYEEEPPAETMPPAKLPKEETTEKRFQPAPITERENRRPEPSREKETTTQQRRPQEYEYYGDEYDERPKTTFKKPGVVLRTSTSPPPPPRTTIKIPDIEEEPEEVRPKLTSDRFSSRIPSSGSFSFGTGRLRPKEESPEQLETPFRSNLRQQQYTGQRGGPEVEEAPEEPQYRQVVREKYPEEDFEDTYERQPQEDPGVREVTRPVVRVVKRPFLPSRGGSPVLPRGLQPVGVNSKEVVTESSIPLDLGSTVSGVRMLEHSPPVLRFPHEYNQPPPQKFTYNGPRTTQAPQIDVPNKSTLEEIYNSDYDVTLNDALNPTLKPIAPSRAPNLGFSISAPAKLLERSRYSLPHTAADVHYSSSQLRPVQLPTAIRRHAPPYADQRSHVPLYELDY